MLLFKWAWDASVLIPIMGLCYVGTAIMGEMDARRAGERHTLVRNCPDHRGRHLCHLLGDAGDSYAMTFSIIVPTFNEERILAKTLGAIRHHLSNIDYELIVTDDGSTDRTCEIAERYADRVVSNT